MTIIESCADRLDTLASDPAKYPPTPKDIKNTPTIKPTIDGRTNFVDIDKPTGDKKISENETNINAIINQVGEISASPLDVPIDNRIHKKAIIIKINAIKNFKAESIQSFFK